MQKSDIERIILTKIRHAVADSDSLQSVINTFPEKWRPLADTLGKLYLDGQTTLSVPVSDELLFIIEPMELAKSNGLNQRKIIENWLDHPQRLELVSRSAILRFRAALIYVAWLTTFMFACLGMFALKVAPAMQEVFHDITGDGVALPLMTRLFLGESALFNYALPMVAVIVLIPCAITIVIGANVDKLRRLPGWLSSMSFLIPITREFGALLYLKYAACLQGSGNLSTQIKVTRTLSNFDPSESKTDMAEAVSFVAAEIEQGGYDYYAGRLGDSLSARMTNYLATSKIVIMIAAGLMVGAFLIAMYMPIFKLGETV